MCKSFVETELSSKHLNPHPPRSISRPSAAARMRRTAPSLPNAFPARPNRCKELLPSNATNASQDSTKATLASLTDIPWSIIRINWCKLGRLLWSKPGSPTALQRIATSELGMLFGSMSICHSNQAHSESEVGCVSNWTHSAACLQARWTHCVSHLRTSVSDLVPSQL